MVIFPKYYLNKTLLVVHIPSIQPVHILSNISVDYKPIYHMAESMILPDLCKIADITWFMVHLDVALIIINLHPPTMLACLDRVSISKYVSCMT